LKRLLEEFPDRFGFSVSRRRSLPIEAFCLSDVMLPGLDTTRTPREGEVHGVAYHFTQRDNFTGLIQDGAFIEHAEYSGNLYGTSFSAVEDVAKSGRRCILDIDAQVRTN
jgi:guanylate kinase